jgi:hypothetical protein
MKHLRIGILFCLFFALARPVAADYVLPYPSYMPGNKLYSISRVMDKVRLLWSFGDIAQLKANIALADKYFIEAKTLFEYKQYLLGTQALMRSNGRLAEIPQLLRQGAAHRKDMTLYAQAYTEDLKLQNTHIDRLLEILPQEFLWAPEKADATNLPLGQLLRNAKDIRLGLMQL